MSKNKKTSIVITILVTAILLTAGTFAWQQMVNKVNEFIGQKTGTVGRDDFDPGTGLKDVYVENHGSAEAFVRIKLREAMNVANNTWRPSAEAHWRAHTYEDYANNCKKTSHAGELFHSYFVWEMGGQKYYMPSDGSQPIVQDAKQYNGTEPGVKQTPYIGPNNIIKVATYLAMTDAQRNAFIGWIYDIDGYAYWSQPLKQGDATGLLLHKVNKDPRLNNTDYYYAIDVIFETVDFADIPMWTQGAESVDGSGIRHQQATAQGKSVLNHIITLSAALTETSVPTPAVNNAGQIERKYAAPEVIEENIEAPIWEVPEDPEEDVSDNQNTETEEDITIEEEVNTHEDDASDAPNTEENITEEDPEEDADGVQNEENTAEDDDGLAEDVSE